MRTVPTFVMTLATLSALASPALAQEGPVLLPPAAIGEIFCLGMAGNDMAPVEGGLLTGDLGAAIDAAKVRSDLWAASNPGEKPPLGDGIPWSIVPDYAAECTVGDVIVNGTQALVTIAYGFPDYPEADTADTLVLVTVQDGLMGRGRWRIDNIVYSDGNDLRQALGHAFVDYD